VFVQLEGFNMWDGILSPDYHGELKGRRVVVAGGGSGIGAALVSGLHWLGASICIFDKNADEAEALVRRLEGGHRPQIIRTDLGNETERRNAVAKACEGGAPKALISTIGLDKRIDLGSQGQFDTEDLLRVNFIAPIMLARDFVNHIRSAGGGAICIFSSHHGSDLCDTHLMGYGAAKAALDNGIRRLAKFAGAENTAANCVRVFGIRPGWVMTEKQTSRFEQSTLDAAVHQQTLPVRMAAIDLVPFVISAICDRNARLLTGTVIDYDAGGHLGRDPK
jgi:NAD(P)-dependent dehydrogenase (short-subunit alcohol dehydrogenase family)